MRIISYNLSKNTLYSYHSHQLVCLYFKTHCIWEQYRLHEKLKFPSECCILSTVLFHQVNVFSLISSFLLTLAHAIQQIYFNNAKPLFSFYFHISIHSGFANLMSLQQRQQATLRRINK